MADDGYDEAEKARADLIIPRSTRQNAEDSNFSKMAIAMGYILKQSRKSTETVGELQRSIEFTQDDVNILRAEKDTLQTQVNNLSLKLAEVERNQRVDRLFAEDTRDQLNVVDNNVKHRNLTIDGIKVTPGENPTNIAWDILRRMDNQLRFEDIDKAFRSGVSRGGGATNTSSTSQG